MKYNLTKYTGFVLSEEDGRCRGTFMVLRQRRLYFCMIIDCETNKGRSAQSGYNSKFRSGYISEIISIIS